jgi:hypothetical protein
LPARNPRILRADNDARNEVAVRIIAKELQLGDTEGLRLRCIGHIINLVCKAFLTRVKRMRPRVGRGLALRQACGELLQSTPKHFEHFQNVSLDEPDAFNRKFPFFLLKKLI